MSKIIMTSKNFSPMKMKDEVNKDVVNKLKNLTYKSFCENFVDEFEDMILTEDMKGTFTTLIDFVKLAIKHDYKIPQKYQPSKKSPEGRLFVQGSGIQKLPKKVRGILCDGIYKDYDMVNAHPKCLLYICRKENIECDIDGFHFKYSDAWGNRRSFGRL